MFVLNEGWIYEQEPVYRGGVIVRIIGDARHLRERWDRNGCLS